MRLWHQDLIRFLPRQQLLGQHRECCALRGAGWGRKHSVVNYVFTHDPARLVAYHYKVMDEMHRRGYKPDKAWLNPNWRGSTLGECPNWTNPDFVELIYNESGLIYKEHDIYYLHECIQNLKSKGIEIEEIKNETVA